MVIYHLKIFMLNYCSMYMIKNQGIVGKSDGGQTIHHMTGYNFKYTNLQASIVLNQIKSFDIFSRSQTGTWGFLGDLKNTHKNEPTNPCSFYPSILALFQCL